MANVKWDVKEIMSQHNMYVDALLKASALGSVFLDSHSGTAGVLSLQTDTVRLQLLLLS